MLKRAYVEITNICNLACSFCPGTSRPPRTMSPDEFRTVAERLRPCTEYLYLHVMGEPLLHPALGELLAIAGELGFRVNLTTNGTLLGTRADLLTWAAKDGILRKIAVSVHSFEGNGGGDMTDYLTAVWAFAQRITRETDAIVSLRLWNGGGAESRNGEIYAFLSEKLGTDVCALPVKVGSRSLGERLFLEEGEKFDWPSLSAAEREVTYCLGLTRQIAVLSDGTVVPCCLDGEGVINLGNLLCQTADEILSGPRAEAFRRGMQAHRPSEELCRRCGYATRF